MDNNDNKLKEKLDELKDQKAGTEDTNTGIALFLGFLIKAIIATLQTALVFFAYHNLCNHFESLERFNALEFGIISLGSVVLLNTFQSYIKKFYS